MLPKMSEDATTTTTTTSLNKNMTSTLLPSTNNNNNGGQDTPEGRTTRGDHSNPIDTTTTENREGSGSISSTSYKAIRYAHLSTSQKHTNYTQIKSKHRTGKRCYRLNLERPFDITCEQSPLEYGDIFAPWTKEVRPRTRGPSEYCPPRHLGGGGEVWRRLVAFAGVSSGHGHDEEEGSSSSGGGWFSKSSGGNGNSSSTTEGGVEGGAGWRKLSPTELEKVQRLGEKNSNGEYSFVTYDLYHVKNHHVLEAMNADHQRTLTPSTSLDSESSEDDDAKPKSATVKADETARLFRRSELSLRDKAEAEAKKHAAEMARIKAERQAKEKAEIDALKSIKGPKGMTKRLSKKASFRAKSVMRSLSTSDRTSSSMSNSSSRGGIYEGGNAMTRRKMVSTQAGMIEKAKDVIDEESDDEYDGEKVRLVLILLSCICPICLISIHPLTHTNHLGSPSIINSLLLTVRRQQKD